MLDMILDIRNELSTRHGRACFPSSIDQEARADVVKYLEEKYIVKGKWTNQDAQRLSQQLGGQQ